jgi:hypothetical protein
LSKYKHPPMTMLQESNGALPGLVVLGNLHRRIRPEWFPQERLATMPQIEAGFNLGKAFVGRHAAGDGSEQGGAADNGRQLERRCPCSKGVLLRYHGTVRRAVGADRGSEA